MDFHRPCQAKKKCVSQQYLDLMGYCPNLQTSSDRCPNSGLSELAHPHSTPTLAPPVFVLSA